MKLVVASAVALIDRENRVLLGRRPAHIVATYEVPFSHQRDVSLKRAADFQELRGELASRIE